MKLSRKIVMSEVLIVLSLALFSMPFVIAIGVKSRMGFFHPLLQLSILGLAHFAISCGVMLLIGVRKPLRLVVRAVVSGVVAAGLMAVAVGSGSTYALVLSKMACGEGGIVHRVGEARMRSPDGELAYSVYWGDVKYANGNDMRELILLANGPVQGKSMFCSPMLLVGKDRVLCPNGLSVARLISGLAAVTCHGGVDITSDKVDADARLSIVNSNSVRTYRCELYDWNRNPRLETRRAHYLDIPFSCFAEIGEALHDEAQSADAGGEDWSDAARLIAGPKFLDRALGDQMSAANEYDVKLEHPFLFFPKASYSGTGGAGGKVGLKGCVLWFKSPSVEYAVEHVLAPVTNALVNEYDIPLAMSPDTKRGMFWKRDLSAVHDWQSVEIHVLLEGHGKTDEHGYETCLLVIGVMDVHLGKRALSELKRNWWQVVVSRTWQDPIAVDDWHELSPGSVDRRRFFSSMDRLRMPDKSFINIGDGRKTLSDYVSGMFGIPFGMDVRTVDGLGDKSLTPVRGKFLKVEPNREMVTNGWRLVSVNVNGRSLTAFGGTVRREFSDRGAATEDLKRVIGEIESAGHMSLKMSALGNGQGFAESQTFDPHVGIGRVKEESDGTFSYQIHIERRSLQQLIHVMTTHGCTSSPE